MPLRIAINIASAACAFVLAFLMTNRRPVPETNEPAQAPEPHSRTLETAETGLEVSHQPSAVEADPFETFESPFPPDTADSFEVPKYPTDPNLQGYQRAREDPIAATEWLATLAPGSFRDNAIGGFVRRTFEDDPVTAASWADSIDDPAIRERFLRVALRQLKAVDPESAELSIRAAGLSQMALESLSRP